VGKSTAVDAWESLFRAQVAVMRRLTAEFPSGPVSLGEYDVMFTLSTQPGRRLRLRDLGEHVLLTQPSVSRLVDRLAARGFVDKLADPADARGVIVMLNDSGFEVFRQAALHHMESISRTVGAALSCDELARLKELCDTLRRNLPPHS